MVENQALKILFIEDMPEDLELAKRKIKSSGIEFESYLAETENEFLKGLYEFKPDIIISDYLLPEFDGMRALEIVLTYDNTIPFIILTGAANEEIIVDAMKAGANDYILKERISRLPFAIQEAVKKRDILLKEKQASESLDLYSKIVEQSPYSVISTDMEGIITSWNRGAERIFGYSCTEVLGRHISLVYNENDLHILNEEVIKPLLLKGYNYRQLRLKRKNGESFIGSLSMWTINDIRGNITGLIGYTLDITKAVEAEEQLRIKNQAIEHNVDGIAMLDLEGRVTYANKSAIKMWGYNDKTEVRGKKVEDFWDDKDEANKLLNNIRRRGFKKELLAKRKDGSVFPVLMSTSVIKNASDEIIAYMGSLVDLSEEKRSEKALKESEKLYRILAENTLDCIWVMNTDTVFTYVNPAITTMLGFTPQEWVGSKLMDHCDEENFRKMMEYIQIAIKEAENFPGIIFQTEVFNKKRETVPVEIIGKIFADENGKAVAIHGTTRDITSRIQAQKALKESEEQLRLAMAVSEHGFWDWNLGTDEFYLSPKSYALLGYENEEFPMTPQIWGQMMHPDDRSNILPAIIRAIRAGEGFSFEIRMLSKSGEYRWMLAKEATFSNKKGNVRAIGTLVDITERKKTEEQMLLARIAAEQANRCKSELLANMNHELRTPLNSVIGYTEVLLEGNRGYLNKEQKNYLKIIDSAGQKLLELINNVLDLAQAESDGMRLQLTIFKPDIVIKNVIEDTKPFALKKKIRLNADLGDNIPEITADAEKFREVLYNLIENALKFTSENGEINVKVTIENENVLVSVEDNGIGIEEKDKERIFDPFAQVDGSNTRRYGGAGLGLALAREYVRMQNGTIWVESKPDRGSKFTFTLPVNPMRRICAV